MQRSIRNNLFWVISCITTIKLLLRRAACPEKIRRVQGFLRLSSIAFVPIKSGSLSKGRTLVLNQFYSTFVSRKGAKFIKQETQRFIRKNVLCVFAIPIAIMTLRLGVKFFVLLCAFVSPWFISKAQRIDINLDNDWQTSLVGTNQWKKVNIPHNWDDYYGYRRLLHGNLHGDAVYKKTFTIKQNKTGKRFFLFFEGVGSYATVILNNKKVGSHAGGRTTFTLDVTDAIKTDGTQNQLEVKASHPANIKDLPWVCGGCSEERGFSEGSQPLGIFRPVHLVITSDVRIEPFGIHAYANIKDAKADLFVSAKIKNYSSKRRHFEIIQELKNKAGHVLGISATNQPIEAGSYIEVSQPINELLPILWSIEKPYLYEIVSTIMEGEKVVDRIKTDFGFRTIDWKTPTNQFLLNGKPVFINGVAEYEHLLGQSHAFSHEQIIARMKWIRAAGFNAFRDGHQPHNLLYGKLCNEKGILWWTQLSAHVWYDTKEFRENFKKLLTEWVIERRNDPSVVLWGLQNESKLPEDFAKECTELIRSLDPTTSSQRLVTTCNGGSGTDWDVPQNWTGTYGGDPKTYAADLKKQILVGEYGAWRTLDLHTEGGYVQNGILSEDRMTQLMEQKVRLAESVKDSVAGHIFWLLTSHDNPGRVQGGEGLRELDRIGPVNYKGLLTPWEEPTDAFYMFRSNYASKEKDPMVYIVSHTWPNRWMTPGIKDSIYVYSNCDEVELFNDIDNVSLGRRKRNGIGTHFQWDKVNIQYNVLYAVGYVNGKPVARDTIVLFHLPQSPNYFKLFTGTKNIIQPQSGYYLYRINCGGADYVDANGSLWQADNGFSRSWANEFPGVPENFASQRRIFSPIKNTTDWSLFQSFRYGKEKLQYEFQLSNGEYLVELYFIEPWLGVGGGMNGKGMRLFDVAVNGKTVLNDLDIWTEAGTNNAVKKVVTANVTDGKMVISFPETKAGQAVISAIAIAQKDNPGRQRARRNDGPYIYQAWLDIGNKQYAYDTGTINTLPPSLFGADWVLFRNRSSKGPVVLNLERETDVFVAIPPGKELVADIKDFENTKTEIITDENGGTRFGIYRKRFPAGKDVTFNITSDHIVILKAATNMQPAYDLKPVTQYRANVVKLSENASRDSVNGRYCAVINNDNVAVIDYPIQTGVADIYSITMKYFYDKDASIQGKLKLIGPGNTMMLEEPVQFNFTNPGKWNQFTINTNNMINAGNYVVRLTISNAGGLAISSVDIQ